MARAGLLLLAWDGFLLLQLKGDAARCTADGTKGDGTKGVIGPEGGPCGHGRDSDFLGLD